MYPIAHFIYVKGIHSYEFRFELTFKNMTALMTQLVKMEYDPELDFDSIDSTRCIDRITKIAKEAAYG